MKSILPEQYAIEKQFNSRVDIFLSMYKIEKHYDAPTFKNKKDLAVLTFLNSFSYLSLMGKTFIAHCNLELSPEGRKRT